jgi:Flp pilus assembly protein TadG
VKTGSLPRRLAGLARRFLCHERGAITPLFVLMLVPICGVLAIATELGNATLQQRAQQHAADAAALAAAMRANNTANDTLANENLEGTGVVARYTAGNVTSAAITTDWCPGTATTFPQDCLVATVNGTAPTYLAQVVGIRSFTTKAVAYARYKSNVDLCMVSLLGDITLDGGGSTSGWSQCYAENLSSSANVKCTSNDFAGVFTAGSASTCTNVKNISAGTNPYSVTSKVPNTSQVPCDSGGAQADMQNINKYTFVTDTYYLRICNQTVALTGSISTATPESEATAGLTNTGKNVAIILDNSTIDLNGNNSLTATNSSSTTTAGTTFIETNSNGSTLPLPFDNSQKSTGGSNPTVTIQGPQDGSGTWADYALVDNDATTFTSAAAFNPKNNQPVNLNILGIVYEPLRSLTLNGNIDSSVGGLSCQSIVAGTISSNGGKFTKSPTADCASRYTLLTQQASALVALVK